MTLKRGGFCDAHASEGSSVNGLPDVRSVEEKDSEMVGKKAYSRSIQGLETPYQASLRMLNSVISHTEDFTLKKQLKSILHHLEDPDTLHVIKHHHLQRAAADDSTLRYIKGVFNTENPIKMEVHNRSQCRSKAKSNWKKVCNIVAILVALERAKKRHLKLKRARGLKDGQELKDVHNTGANGDDGMTPPSFTMANKLLVLHQSAIQSLVSEVYEHLNNIFTVDAYQVPSLEITRQYEPVILPGLNPNCVVGVHDLLANNAFLSWDFNIFALDEVSNKHSFWYAVMSVLLHFNLPGMLRINMDHLSSMLLHTERTYCFNVHKVRWCCIAKRSNYAFQFSTFNSILFPADKCVS